MGETGQVMIRAGVPFFSLLVLTSLGAACTASTSKNEPRRPAQSSYLELAEPMATKCTGTLGAVQVDGDLLVPRGRSCRLNGTAVGGRVTVSPGASLLARDARFGEGISAHAFERVELLGGRVEGRPRDWSYGNEAEDDQIVDFLFESGGDVAVRYGPSHGRYYFLENTGQVEVVGLGLDLGRVYCAGNTHPPKVRDVSGESPGVLHGQCAGLRNFGDSDF